jgi:hypothetical protein
MKTIPLRNNERVNSKTVILAVAKSPEPGKGITFAEMGKRMRIIDAAERIADSDETFSLEDADHDLLVRLIQVFPFQIADRELHDIISDVVNAK